MSPRQGVIDRRIRCKAMPAERTAGRPPVGEYTGKKDDPGTCVPGSDDPAGFAPARIEPGATGYGTGRPACAGQLAVRREREPDLAALPASAAAFSVALVAAAKFDSAALAAWRAALEADS